VAATGFPTNRKETLGPRVAEEPQNLADDDPDEIRHPLPRFNLTLHHDHSMPHHFDDR
jgi:hypothetical protein